MYRAAQPGGDVVFHQPPHPAQFPQRVEVAHQRHIRVRGRAVIVEQHLRERQQRRRDPNLDALEPDALRAHPHIAPPGVILIHRNLPGEERVLDIEAGWGEHRQLPAEQRVGLLVCPAHRGCGGHHLRSHAPPVDLPGGQLVHRGLIQPDHGSQRVGDQVQLVLDDQIDGPEPPYRRRDRGRQTRLGVVPVRAAHLRADVRMFEPVPRALPGHVAEQVPRGAVARQLRELVHGGDQQRWREAVDLLVHRQYRQTVGVLGLGEFAPPCGVPAVDVHPPGGLVRFHVGLGGDR